MFISNEKVIELECGVEKNAKKLKELEDWLEKVDRVLPDCVKNPRGYFSPFFGFIFDKKQLVQREEIMVIQQQLDCLLEYLKLTIEKQEERLVIKNVVKK